jgi:accessory gene regulator B
MADVLVNLFLKNKIIECDRAEVYKTGIKLILSDIINFSAIILIGFLTKTVTYSFIYLLLFWSVRKFSGGFHAHTYLMCRIFTIGIYGIITIVSMVIKENYLVYTTICDVFTVITVICFAPIKHPNKMLSDIEIKGNKILSLLTTLFFSAISVLLVLADRKEGVVIALTLFAISILMYVGLLMNRKEVTVNEKH